VFMIVNVVAALVFAVASWLLVERPIMRATRAHLRTFSGTKQTTTAN